MRKSGREGSAVCPWTAVRSRTVPEMRRRGGRSRTLRRLRLCPRLPGPSTAGVAPPAAPPRPRRRRPRRAAARRARRCSPRRGRACARRSGGRAPARASAAARLRPAPAPARRSAARPAAGRAARPGPGSPRSRTIAGGDRRSHLGVGLLVHLQLAEGGHALSARPQLGGEGGELEVAQHLGVDGEDARARPRAPAAGSGAWAAGRGSELPWLGAPCRRSRRAGEAASIPRSSGDIIQVRACHGRAPAAASSSTRVSAASRRRSR